MIEERCNLAQWWGSLPVACTYSWNRSQLHKCCSHTHILRQLITQNQWNSLCNVGSKQIIYNLSNFSAQRNESLKKMKLPHISNYKKRRKISNVCKIRNLILPSVAMCVCVCVCGLTCSICGRKSERQKCNPVTPAAIQDPSVGEGSHPPNLVQNPSQLGGG